MTSRTKVGTGRGWDIGLAAAILGVVLLGWLSAPGDNGAVPHSGRLVGPAQLSGRTGPGGAVTGNFYPAPRPRGGNGGAVARGPALPHR
jgi:hypothetical protein